jgi:hypothetical protein
LLRQFFYILGTPDQRPDNHQSGSIGKRFQNLDSFRRFHISIL